MHALRRRAGVRGGFVHVPMLPEQAAARGLGAGMALSQMQRGVALALQAALAHGADIRAEGGRLD
jgi:pyroglutamyl-peptidase